MSIRQAIRSVVPYRFQSHPYRVKLDQNESPYDLPEGLKERVMERLQSTPLHRYPEIHPRTLQEKIAHHFDWPIEGVVIAGGSNVLIRCFVIIAGIGQEVLVVTPSFPVYALQARQLGAKLIEVPLQEDFSLPISELIRASQAGKGVVFLANPAAPTGNLHPQGELEKLVSALGSDWTVVLDEAYGPFAGSDFRELVRRYPQVASLRTFSKAPGLAGVRLGFGLMHPELAEQLRKVVMPFSLSSLQSAVGEEVLDAPEYLIARIAEVRSERERLYARLQKITGVEVFPSVTNFLLLRVADADAVHRALLDKKILVRRQDHLPALAGCLRVSVGTPEENDIFLQALSAALGSEVTSHG